MSSSRKDKGQVGSSKKKSTSKGASSATAGTSGFLCGAAAAASASPENQVHEELADVNAAIAKVENKIAKVENKISTIEDQLDDKDKYWKKLSDQDRKEEYDNDRTKWVKELREEKKQLREKEKQLREKEKQLREEKKQLREKEKQLREEKKQLNERFNEHLKHQNRLASASGAKRGFAGAYDGVGQGHSKRIAILRRGESTDIGILFSHLDETQMSEGGDVYTFAAKVLDSRYSSLWERPVYKDIYDVLWQRAIKGDDFFPVVITGTSGIGKSFFGIYAIFRAVREMQITVVYKTYGADNSKRSFVIAPPQAMMESFKEGDSKRLLLDLRIKYAGMIGEDKMDMDEDENHRTSKSMWWGELTNAPDSSHFVQQLLGGTSTWLFVDVEEGKVAESSHRTVVLVSDDDKSVRSFAKHKGAASLVMPIWSLDELQLCCVRMKLQLGQEVVRERYMEVGGIPRSVLVFDKDQYKQILKELHKAISELTPQNLGNCLVPGSNPRVTSRLVHQLADAPFDEPSTVFASEYVRTKLYKRFLLSNEFALKTWLQYTKGIVGGSERGAQFEWFAHVVLGKLEKKLPVKVTELPLQNGVPEPANVARESPTEEVSLAPFASKSTLYKALKDIKRLEFGEYMQPRSENEAAIDSFCLSKGVPWEESLGDDPILLMFQMTVAVKHPTLGKRIQDIIAHVHKVSDFDKTKHKIYLVFITEKRFSKAEAYLKIGKKEQLTQLGDLTQVRQFCLQIN